MTEAIIIGAIGTILTIVITKIFGVLNQVLKNQKEEREEADSRRTLMEDATLASIRVQLVQSSYSIMFRGYVTAFERDAYDDLFKMYIKLGGNSFVSDLHCEIMKLPIKDSRIL